MVFFILHPSLYPFELSYNYNVLPQICNKCIIYHYLFYNDIAFQWSRQEWSPGDSEAQQHQIVLRNVFAVGDPPDGLDLQTHCKCPSVSSGCLKAPIERDKSETMWVKVYLTGRT